ncbi:HDIG domain-containing metalloprotein [Chloroflexota bacterium]
MNRDDAMTAVQKNVRNDNLVKHMLATEAIMQALAQRLGEDEDTWAVAGLLHDIDIELTEGDMARHALVGADMVREMGFNDEIAHAVASHNEQNGTTRNSGLDRALYCADPLTGLITAAALVRPDRKLAGVQEKSIRKRFKEKSFAAGARREQIAACSEIGLELDEFLALGLTAMQGIAGPLGL